MTEQTRDPIADDIFLSPRIIDMKAFEDLESRLRAIISRALETGQAIVSLDEQARESLAALTAAALDERARAAEAMLTSLEERLRGAEALLARGVERAERAERFERDVEETMQRAERALADRLDVLVADAEVRLERLQTRSAARIEQLEAECARAIEKRVEEAIARAASIRESLGEAKRDAERGLANLERRLTAMRDEAERVHAPMLDRLEELCHQATTLLGQEGPDDAAAPGSMAALVDRAGSLRHDTEVSVRQLEHVARQTDQARQLIARSLVDATEELDHLDARRRDLHAGAAEAAALCDQSRSELERASAELRELIGDPIARAQAEAERLAALMDRAEAARRDATDALERRAGVLHEIDRALNRLEPWRGVLLEAEDDLPVPLVHVVERFRGEIGRDIGQLADALRDAASRAVAPSRSTGSSSGDA